MLSVVSMSLVRHLGRRRSWLVRAGCLAVVAGLLFSTAGDGIDTLRADGAGRHRAQPAPGQRWGSAAGQDHLTKGTVNRTLPVSQRGRYPRQPAPAEAANVASVETGPVAARSGFDRATSQERTDARGAFERVYANTDGTETTELSAEPINYPTGRGQWAPIDTRLSSMDNGGWQNLANSVSLRFAPRADAAELTSMRLDEGHAIAYGLAGAAPAAGVVEGSAVTYPGVMPGVDLKLEARPGGVKETLVLHGRDVPHSFVFPLRLTGLSASLADGALVLTDASGTRRAVVPPGDMVDAAGAQSTRVAYRLGQGGVALEVTLDSAWLRDPARRYPIQVDPTVTLPVDSSAASSGMYVRGNSSAEGRSELQVGKVAGASTASYLKFAGLDQLAHRTIFGVQLQVVNYDANSCRARPVSVHPVTEPWTAGTGHAYPGPAVGAALASKSFAHGFVAFGQSSSACPTAAELFDLGAEGVRLVQGWVSGTTANNGLSLRANVSDSDSGKRFTGTATANPPRLFITNSKYNATYAIPNPVPNPPVLQNQDGRVKVTVTNRSADAWAPSSYYLAYRAYNAVTGAAVGQQRAANLTSTVARGGRVTLDATIKALRPGTYFLDFTMVATGGIVFTDQQVPPARIVLRVVDVPPVVQELHPPNGYQAPTLTPMLWGRALDVDAPPGSSLSYKFEVCERNAAGAPVGCFDSGYQPGTAWTVPVGRLSWSKAYLWRVFVKDGTNEVASPRSTVLTEVPQPEVTSRIAGASQSSQEREFDAQSGNFSTVAVDATVTTVGPELNVIRTYNSLDPRRDNAFGAGWTTRYDMRLVPDDDGSGNVVITYPDGQAVRFGRNPNGSYATASGRTAVLTREADGWKLADRAGVTYQFSGTGRLTRIADAAFRSVLLTYNFTDGKLAKAQVSNSQTNTAGRALRFTWSGSHVSAVTNDLNNTWTYTYAGDLLTTVCAPGNSCTRYTYAAGSHYRGSVLDSRPESYWRLGEAEGTAAGSEIAVNLGKDAGTYTNVALGVPGAAAGSGGTAASFNGTSSRVNLPKGLLKKSRDAAVELWFKSNPTGFGGPLLGYQDKAFGTTPGRGVPVLYIGTDGKLHGQFGATAISPAVSSRGVNDGQWHHVVLSLMGSTMTMYLDGEPVGPPKTVTVDHAQLTFNQVGAASVSTPGSWPNWGTAGQRFFNGTIDEVAVYSHPLGKTSVQAHYRNGAAADQLTAVTLPSGAVAAAVTYDVGLDRVASYTDRNGGTWKVGAPVVYGNDTDLRRGVQLHDPGNRPYLYEYDGLTGQLLRSGTPLGLELREEDRPGAPAPPPPPVEQCPAPDPVDPKFCTVIPGNAGGPVFVQHPLDGMAIRSFQYDDRGNLTVVTNENGHTVTMTHDDRGNVVSRKTCRMANVCHTSYTTYPATAPNPLDPRNDLPTESRDGRSASATDATYRTTYSYTPTGELAAQTLPGGATVRHSYTNGAEAAVGGGLVPPGLLLSTMDARGRVTSYGYYANGDLAKITAPSGLVTTYTYDALGRTISETEVSDSFPAGVTTSHAYDALSRQTNTTQPATTDAVSGTRHQLRTVATYDDDGNAIKEEEIDLLGGDPIRTTMTEYDEHGRPIKVTDPEGNETTSSYDRFGNRISTVDANGIRTDFAYTARNMLAEVRLRAYTGDTQGGLVGDYLVLHSYSYDFAGRLASHTDAMGRRLEYLYYNDDSLQRVVLKNFHNLDGTTRDYILEDNTYDGAGNRTKQVTANGKVTVTQTFNPAGNVASIVDDPGGIIRTTTYTYDPNGNVTRTSRSGNPSNVPWLVSSTPEVVQVDYDDAGNPTEETVVADGTTLVTKSAYDRRGLLVSTTDPRGTAPGADADAYTTRFGYDELERQITDTGPPVAVEGNGGPPTTIRPTSQTGYNTFGEQTALQDEAGNIRRWAYDRAGRTVSASRPAYRAPGATNPITPTTRTRYDGLGNVIEVTDPRDNTTRFTYDQLNRVVTRDEPAATNGERAVSRFTYTRTGQLLSTTDPLGGRAEATYDDLDRSVTSTTVERRPVADNLTTRMTYDDAGNLTRVSSPSGATTTHDYDTIGQRTRTTSPNGVVTQFGYDQSGRTVRLADPIGRTVRTVYDSAGRPVSRSNLRPDGSTVRTQRTAYDPAGNVIASTDALDVTTTYAYDADNRLVRQVEPTSPTSSITTSFGYNAAGQRTRHTNGLNNSTIYTYNTLGLTESVIEPATPTHPNAPDRTWTANYDAAGNVVHVAAPGGISRDAAYDAAGRLTTETGAGASVGTGTRTRGYDLLDRLVSVNAPTGTNTYAYDDRGHLLSARGPGGSADYGYDGDGNVLTRTDASGTARFGYDRGRLASVTDGLTGTVQQYGYDASGLLATVGMGAGRTRSHGYDDLGRMTADTVRNGSGQTVAAITYRFDNNDQLTGKTTAGTAGAGDNSYAYDQAGRLVSWTGPAGTIGYEWDAAGNRTRAGPKTATYDARNRLLSDGDYTYAYTARGTLASRTSSGLTERFEFDAFDRLANAAGQTYAYDGLNRLVSRGSNTFGYAGLSDDPVSDGAERYARGPDDDLLAVAAGQEKNLTLSDEHGDVVAGFAPGDTTLAGLGNSTAYDPFGKKTAAQGNTGNVGYQGDWTDPATGQVNMGARWYNPGTGGFTSRDSAGYPGGSPSVLANKYTYGAAAPMDYTDPDGHWPGCGKRCKRFLNIVSPVTILWTDKRVRNKGWSMFNTAIDYGAPGLRWLYNTTTSFVRDPVGTIKSLPGKARRTWDGIKDWGDEQVERGKTKYREFREKTKREWEKRKRQFHERRRQATELAKKGLALAAKANPIKIQASALKALWTNRKKLVSAAFNLPATVVQVTRDVVNDANKAVNAIHQAVVETAGAVVQGVSRAVEATADLAHAAAPYVKAGLKVAAEVSGVTDLVKCVGKGDLEACAWTAATIAGFALGGAGGGAVRAARVASLAAKHADEAKDAAKGLRRGADSCVPDGKRNSFTADTRVRMADGGSKPISEVTVGDKVLATDPTTGRTEAEPVTDVIIGDGDKELVEVTVASGVITATDGHPFWVASEHRWVEAGDLKPGYRIETADHRPATVAGTRTFHQHQRVYNLTVDTIHTYFVIAGNTDLLVHNDGPDLADLNICPRHNFKNPNLQCNGSSPLCKGPGGSSGGRAEKVDPEATKRDIETGQAQREARPSAFSTVVKNLDDIADAGTQAAGFEPLVGAAGVTIAVVQGSKAAARGGRAVYGKAKDWLSRRGG